MDKNSVYPLPLKGSPGLVNSMSAGTIIIIINLYFLRTHKYLLFIPQHTPANQFQRISVVLYLRYSRSRRTQRGRSKLYIHSRINIYTGKFRARHFMYIHIPTVHTNAALSHFKPFFKHIYYNIYVYSASA